MNIRTARAAAAAAAVLACALPPAAALGQPVAVPRAVLDLALEAVPPNTRPGSAYTSAALDYAMVLGVDRTPKGRLWAAWIAGGDSEKGLVLAASSDDDGATWTEPRLVIDPSDAPPCPGLPGGLPRRALVGNLWTDPAGRLWLFYDQSMGYFDGRAGVWAITCDDPDAAEPAWSAPRRIWHGATLNKPTVLSDGTWLLPVSLWDRSRIGPAALRDCHRDLDGLRMAHVLASEDRGRTWKRRGGVDFPRPEFDEHSVVELKDGQLWMLARTADGLAESFSSDRGAAWSEPRPSAVRHTSARVFLRRLASGRLLLVKHGRIDERTPKRSHLTAFLSDDEGKTWTGGLVIDEREGVSYPDGFQAPDGTITVVYDRNRAADREVLLARFTEADAAAGRFGSARAASRVVVHKARGRGWTAPPPSSRGPSPTAWSATPPCGRCPTAPGRCSSWPAGPRSRPRTTTPPCRSAAIRGGPGRRPGRSTWASPTAGTPSGRGRPSCWPSAAARRCSSPPTPGTGTTGGGRG